MNTINPNQTVGELVKQNPAYARVFEQFRIDYCCGGGKPLAQACAARGVEPQVVTDALNAVAAPAQAERNWSDASMTDLANHIEDTHHAYLKSELPRLDHLVCKVATRHGDSKSYLVELRDTFLAFRDELMLHMAKEERILFPLCRKLESAGEPQQFHCGSVRNPIAVMIREHDDAGTALARMRALTDDFTPPTDACNTFRALYESLARLEQDMHRHIHKENSILFPRAVDVESRLMAAGV